MSGFRNFSRSSQIFTILSAAGIVDAVYHAYTEFTAHFTCNINSTFNCGNVFSTGHTHIFGIPFWVLGVVWFPACLILGLVTSQKFGNKRDLNGIVLLLFLMIGNLFTVYLWYLDLAIIYPAVKSICEVCVSLYCINYALTGVAAYQIARPMEVSTVPVAKTSRPTTAKTKKDSE
jgi:uncharacterized membrane protein